MRSFEGVAVPQRVQTLSDSLIRRSTVPSALLRCSPGHDRVQVILTG